MGTPEFAVASLDKLLQQKYDVAAVITAPDRKAGRGRKQTQSAVKKYALEHDLSILQPTNLKSENFLKELQGFKANLFIVVAFRMLPKEVWQIPDLGTFNLHASLLPDYRGAAPINWAIIKGETQSGVTTFFIDSKIDTGEIIAQQETHIAAEENAGELHDRLMKLGANLVLKTVQGIQNNSVNTQKQPPLTLEKKAPKIHKETCKIDWGKPLEDIYNHIRGLSPYPTAWTTLYDEDEQFFLKIYNATTVKSTHSLKPGSLLIENKNMKVAVKGGFIQLDEIQFPGKRRMKTKEILNGLKLSENSFLS